MIDDVPSPIDLRLMADALEWESTAMSKRPWRTEFFACFSSAIKIAAPSGRVLELGSGPGFLVDHLVRELLDISYVALDFSAAMNQLAVRRLGAHASRIQFIERSFCEPNWPQGLGAFDCVVTNQAVHELRHKAHAPALHKQVKNIVSSGGSYLVCDHFAGNGGMKNADLYMSVAEQKAALLEAGFSNVEQLLLKGGLVLHHAT